MNKKKITVKPFLNKRLTAEEADDGMGNPSYRLYFLITYNRKNTHIKSHYGMFYSDLEDPEAKKIIEFESKILRKIIEFETRHLEMNSYELTGLKAKFEAYSSSISYTFSEYLKKKLYKAILKTNDELMMVLEFKGFKRNFDNLYKASKLLFKGFDKKCVSDEFKAEIKTYKMFLDLCSDRTNQYDFPTLIDWKEGSFKSVFENQLMQKLKNKQKVAEVIEIIDFIIAERLINIAE